MIKNYGMPLPIGVLAMVDLPSELRLALVPYRQLLTEFVSETITADAIEARYITLFTNDSTDWPDDLFRILEAFFIAVDDYVAEDRLRTEPEDIDADELRTRAQLALELIEQLERR